MPTQYFRKTNLILAFALISLIPAHTFAQANNSRPRITQAVDATKMMTLRGNTHPLARAEFDRGAAPGNLPMEHMLLVLKRSPEQEATLEKLMAEQQDPSSPNFHHWLTPEQFGEQFGPADQDVQTIKSWLESRGFQVNEVTKGRTVIDFSGNADQVQQGFHTAIHKFVQNNGQENWANAGDPSIPAAFAPVVAGVNTLHNFPKKPMSHVVSRFTRSRETGEVRSVDPQFTFPAGCTTANCNFAIGPADFATIYNLTPLWNTGIDGTGQTIAVVTDSNINVSDVTTFRSLFGLPVKNPNVIVNGTNPGPTSDEIEAVLDVEWAGAVAKNATIDLVVSRSTNTTFGGDLSAMYIINNHLAPILSESFGLCELELGTAGNSFYNAMWQQAASQGITVIVSTGDNGSSGCDLAEVNGFPTQPATLGLQVNGIASTPFNIAVGGTDFNDLSNPGTYWSTTNTSVTQASALSYIPETTWNDTCTNSFIYQSSFFGFNSSGTAEAACNNNAVQIFGNSSGIHLVAPLGASGGLSNCTTSNGFNPLTCSGGYSKPSWQAGITPSDGKRDLPDVSLFGADGLISGSFYVVCEADENTNNAACSLNSPYLNFLGIGGTSVSAQVFAGIMALVDQKTASSQGNANAILYPLSTSASAASIYHSVPTGTIAMPCAVGTPNCVVSSTCKTSSVKLEPMGGIGRFRLPGAGPALVLGWALCICFLFLAYRHKKSFWIPTFALFTFLITNAGCGGGGGGTTTTNPSNCTVGILSGFNASSSYNLATGLGSVNVANLVNTTNFIDPKGWPTATNGADFTLSLSSSNVTIANPGGTGTTTLNIIPAGGFSASVTPSCSGLPAATTCTFSPNPVAGSGSTVVTFTTTGGTIGSTPLGTTIVVVTATSGIVQRSVTVTLIVN